MKPDPSSIDGAAVKAKILNPLISKSKAAASLNIFVMMVTAEVTKLEKSNVANSVHPLANLSRLVNVVEVVIAPIVVRLVQPSTRDFKELKTDRLRAVRVVKAVLPPNKKTPVNPDEATVKSNAGFVVKAHPLAIASTVVAAVKSISGKDVAPVS